jgi:predicted transcriptional regulator
MTTNGTDKIVFTTKIKEILSREPGLSVKELSERLGTNRQFMAGVLKILESVKRFSAAKLVRTDILCSK